MEKFKKKAYVGFGKCKSHVSTALEISICCKQS